MSPRQRRPRPCRRRRWLVALAIVAPLVLLGFTAAGGAVYFGSNCDLSTLRPVRQGESSLVYGANGGLVGVLPAAENRTVVPRSAIVPWLPKATVAIEDRRFYGHGGIDPIGILRALVADASAGHIVQGGSTITQELVRNLYLSSDRTLQRKVVEACLAIKLARAWPKDRILTAYLNDVYYGNHAYGVEAAAETYFSLPASRLTLEQAALLAGLPQAPSYYDPLHNPRAARLRRNEVLHALWASGDISAREYAAARRDRSLHLRPSPAYGGGGGQYFLGYVEDLLRQAYGAAAVRAGGLRIYTTIRPRLQREAQTALAGLLPERTDPAGAIVSLDPGTGAILAMAGVAPGVAANEFNLATSGERQAGSTFKPIVLAAAVARGMNPWATRYLSAPFYDPALQWRVRTYDGSYAGPESVAAATIRSDNTVFARLALDVGPDAIVAMAQKLGVRTPLRAAPSLALGSGAVTPLDMASVYSTLAADGVYAQPRALRKVVFPGGKVDAAWGRPHRLRAIPAWVAATVTRILEANMLRGTGVGAHVSGLTDAGKTGTTDDYADAWFCGYTPSLEATVWIGYPQGEIPMLDVHGAAVSGPTLPAAAWRLFVERALAGVPDRSFSALSSPQFSPWEGRLAYRAPAAATASVSTSTSPGSTRSTTIPSPSSP